MYSYGSPHMAAQKQDDQLERTFSSYVRIQDVVLKTYLGRWTIGRSGERGSGISVLPARYDDDEVVQTIQQVMNFKLKILKWTYMSQFAVDIITVFNCYLIFCTEINTIYCCEYDTQKENCITLNVFRLTI